MTPVKILSFKRYADGSCEALISYEKPVTITTQRSHPPIEKDPKTGDPLLTLDEHEAKFFAKIQADVDLDCKMATTDVSDVEGRVLSDVITAKAAPAVKA